MLKKRISFFLLGIISAIILLECSVRAASPLLGPPLSAWNTMEDAKKLKFEEFKLKYRHPQYVFMGNSATLIGFNPSVFDDKAGLPAGASFNAAMNGSDVKTMRDFARAYIISEVKPRNLVILFSNTGMIQVANYKARVSEEKNILNSSYLYKYRNTLRDPMTLNTLVRVLRYRDSRQGIVYRWADNLDDFGYSKYETTNATYSEFGWNPSRTSTSISKKYIVDISKLRYLVEIRDATRKAGVNLIIGTVPLLARDDEYRGLTQSIAGKLGVGFIQGNDAVGQGKYFQDGIHLNIEGAKIFSEFLARELPKVAG
jgi:hypothetical protein